MMHEISGASDQIYPQSSAVTPHAILHHVTLKSIAIRDLSQGRNHGSHNSFCADSSVLRSSIQQQSCPKSVRFSTHPTSLHTNSEQRLYVVSPLISMPWPDGLAHMAGKTLRVTSQEASGHYYSTNGSQLIGIRTFRGHCWHSQAAEAV